ncbi:hypothetical protein [Nitrososphaera sp.]|uniref:hypothetical protein n=1 Tax=Nitrososphaera sp. TaxID=1971748 RepID=UPI002ED87265
MENGDWGSLLHHRSRTTKTEIAQGVVKQLQKNYHWLMVGLKKVPEPYISEVLPTQYAKDLAWAMLDDWARDYRFNQLDREIGRLNEEINRAEKELPTMPRGNQEIEKKIREVQNMIKSRKRRLAMRKRDIAELGPTFDERRLAVAEHMAMMSISYVLEEYRKVMPRTKEAMDDLKQLHDNRDLLTKIAYDIPRQLVINEALRKWEQQRKQSGKG